MPIPRWARRGGLQPRTRPRPGPAPRLGPAPGTFRRADAAGGRLTERVLGVGRPSAASCQLRRPRRVPAPRPPAPGSAPSGVKSRVPAPLSARTIHRAPTRSGPSRARAARAGRREAGGAAGNPARRRARAPPPRRRERNRKPAAEGPWGRSQARGGSDPGARRTLAPPREGTPRPRPPRPAPAAARQRGRDAAWSREPGPAPHSVRAASPPGLQERDASGSVVRRWVCFRKRAVGPASAFAPAPPSALPGPARSRLRPRGRQTRVLTRLENDVPSEQRRPRGLGAGAHPRPLSSALDERDRHSFVESGAGAPQTLWDGGRRAGRGRTVPGAGPDGARVPVARRLLGGHVVTRT